MKKIIIIIVVVLIVVGGGLLGLNYLGSSKKLALNNEQIKNYQNKSEEFLNAVDSGNYNEYKKLSDNKMGEKSSYNAVDNYIKKNLGEYKNISYNEAVKSSNDKYIIYNGDFSKKDNIKIIMGFDSNNKITGFRVA